MSMPDQSGLEQIRALMSSGRRPGMVETLDFQLVEVAEGRAIFEGTPGAYAYNPIGSVYAPPRCSTLRVVSPCTAS